ncbi:MAG: tetratricopeptide repeat protein [Chloroflexi bacterium]|nr:tetratricopeptide repeat protein [Chloroflexota bacterium]
MPNPTTDVLLVTATNVETRAVFQAFREATGRDPQPQALGDKTYHDLGVVNDTRVSLVQSEMGAASLGATLQTVQKGLEALKPGAVVMVGIAFGVNEAKQKMGDILVAKQLTLYEPGRVGATETLPRGTRADCSPRLLDRCRSAELYWDGPAVRFGLILSGEKLVDNLEFRQALLKHEPEAIGGEMEGAGLYVACQDARVDWILVKAICDWGDGHKADDKAKRQAEAARNAAQFVLHTLQKVGLKLERPAAPPSADAGETTIQMGGVQLEKDAQVTIGAGDMAGRDNIKIETHYHGADLSGFQNPTGLKSSFPSQPYFFGREKELASIAEAIAPEARTWGALIDGPGGIGKTALAIRAGHLAPAAHFARKIFLSAKIRQLTPAGEEKLEDFMLPNYLDLLKELAMELGEADIARSDPNERANAVRRALAGAHALIVIDNLETFGEGEQARVFQFLARLPEGNKALVTSRRRRPEVDARAIRLDRLEQADALALLAELAQNNKLLARASEAERQMLYELTHGNPLLLQWAAGQLGRGQCRTVAQACDFLKAAPLASENDPLEYIFGDLVETFTESETKVLAALTHFTQPAELTWIADMAGLPQPAAQTALEDLTDRSILISTNLQSSNSPREASNLRPSNLFFLPPLAALFLKRKRPEAVRQTGDRLTDQIFALALENGYEKYDRFPALEAAWPRLSAALPLFLQGENDRLQTLCDAFQKFLQFSGLWDEQLALSEQAEAKAEAAKDWRKAGWRAYDAGWVCNLRGQGAEVLRWAARAEGHWQTASSTGARERALAIHLRGIGHQLNKDYAAAIAAFRESLELTRTLQAESEDVTIDLTALAWAEHALGDYAAAERDYTEALRIARKVNYQEGVVSFTGNLAELANDRQQWPEAERLAREALPLAEKLGQQELVGVDCHRLALALLRQGNAAEALPHARRAVEIYTKLRYRELDEARQVLAECEAAVAGPA